MTNPLLQIEGLPPFSAITPEDVEPAVRTILDENRQRLEALLAGATTPSWDALVAPMQEMEHQLNRVWSPVGHLNAVANTEPLREAYNACLPLLSDYATELGQNAQLFEAYRFLSAGREELDQPRRKLLGNTLRDFRLAGVDLDPEAKAIFRGLMQELARKQARFEENLLDATHAWQKLISEEDRLAGIPARARSRARQAARNDNQAGWLFTLDYPSYHAVVAHADDPALRREFYAAWSTRASDQGPHAGRWDNTSVMREILRLRHQAARMLGFANFAEYSLATKMAGSVEEVLEFLTDLARRSREHALHEFAELETFAGRRLEAWDVTYYAEKMREQRYGLSDEALRPYFPLPHVLEGMFEVAARLYGVAIRSRDGVDTWHPDVRFFDITDATGRVRGSFYTDLFARERKRGGAWMDECIGRKNLNGSIQLPVAFLVTNFMPPVGDDPALLTHHEVVTLFHEFGHTLHHLLTRVDFPSLAGINGVPWDAVELPSQFMESFAWHQAVLPLISGHYRTAEPLPEAQFQRLQASRTFHAGLQMVRQLEFALFDFHLHTAAEPPDAADIARVLGEVRERVAVVPTPGFNRFAHSFSHIFAGGYAAGYYSYKWAEVLAADAFSVFEQSGIFDPLTAQRFLSNILEAGGTCDAMEAFVAFRGREPSLDPLLRQSGIDRRAAAPAL